MSLSGEACRILFHLAHNVCPATGRVWTDSSRVAERLALSVLLVDELFARLISSGYVTLWANGAGALRCYELGSFFVRAHDAPMNLPVEPDP